jgi:hypothetical protein
LQGTNADQHVHVIRCAVDDKGRAAHLANDATEVRKKIASDLSGDERLAILCAEDQVKDKIASSMRHVSFAPSELISSLGFVSHGFRRGLHSYAASRLRKAYAATAA